MAVNRRFGNSGVSSLLSAAKASYNSAQNLNDQVMSNQWDLSSKTQDDLNAYRSYLLKRASDVADTDPSKHLTLTKAADTAFRSYTSQEINRKSIDISYGNGTDQDKYNAIADLFHQAQANGDEQLAQNLMERAGTLSVSMQNKADAAAARAAAGYAASSRILAENNYIDHNNALQHVDSALSDLQSAFTHGGQAAIKKFAQDHPELKDAFTVDGKSVTPSYNSLQYAIKSLKNTYVNSFSQDPTLTESERDSYAKQSEGLQKDLNALTGHLMSEQNGQQPIGEKFDPNVYDPVAGKLGAYVPVYNPISGVQRMSDGKGGYYNQPIYDKNGVPASQNASNQHLYSALSKDATFKSMGGEIKDGQATVTITDANGEPTTAILLPYGAGFKYLDPNAPSGLSAVRFDAKQGKFTKFGDPISLQEANSPEFNAGGKDALEGKTDDLLSSTDGIVGHMSHSLIKGVEQAGKTGLNVLMGNASKNYAAEQQRQLDVKQAAELAQSRERAAQQSLAALRLPTPNAPAPTYNPTTRMVVGAGPVKTPAAVTQAANTIGTSTFNQAIGSPLLKGNITPNNLPAPAPKPSLFQQATKAVGGVVNSLLHWI